MKFGIFGINSGLLANPEISARAAAQAEAVGFESAWTGEHIVLPDPQVAPSPAPPQTAMLDPSVSLAFLAGHTKKLKLGTGIIILPQRNPVELAKELASLDVLSSGRLLFGLGAGYLQPEFEALNAPFADRGARTDEYIDVLRAMWTMENPAFDGETFRFAGIDAQPRPVQRPHPPVHVGGHSSPALRRAVRRGNGWYGFFVDLERCHSHLAEIAEIQAREGRPEDLGELEISITPLPGAGLDDARAYQDLGVDRLTLIPNTKSEDHLWRWIDETAENVLQKLA